MEDFFNYHIHMAFIHSFVLAICFKNVNWQALTFILYT